jgi:hypothetical protein
MALYATVRAVLPVNSARAIVDLCARARRVGSVTAVTWRFFGCDTNLVLERTKNFLHTTVCGSKQVGGALLSPKIFRPQRRPRESACKKALSFPTEPRKKKVSRRIA